jgi:hypothetical protein
MNRSTPLALSLSLSAICGLAQTTLADSADATCEFYSHGDKEQEKSGTCSFSQHQGNVYIDLRNGQTFSLVPANNKTNQYKDDKGKKVVRNIENGGNKHVYKWDNDDKKIIVSFNQHDTGSSHRGGASGEPTTTTERVRFNRSATGAEFKATLSPGSSVRYVLGAKNGQDLNVRVAGHGPDIYYQIFNPDGSFLLEQMTSAKDYRGQLWQSGDHVIEVINRGNKTTSYNINFSIDSDSGTRNNVSQRSNAPGNLQHLIGDSARHMDSKLE